MKVSDDNQEKSVPWPDLDLDKIRSRQSEYFERHKSFLQRFDGIIDEYLRLFLDISCLAFSCIKGKIDEEFMYAYVILGSRWFSHIESLIYLFYSGYYGKRILNRGQYSVYLVFLWVSKDFLLSFSGHIPKLYSVCLVKHSFSVFYFLQEE